MHQLRHPAPLGAQQPVETEVFATEYLLHFQSVLFRCLVYLRRPLSSFVLVLFDAHLPLAISLL
jgi:hypothetical protein